MKKNDAFGITILSVGPYRYSEIERELAEAAGDMIYRGVDPGDLVLVKRWNADTKKLELAVMPRGYVMSEVMHKTVRWFLLGTTERP